MDTDIRTCFLAFLFILFFVKQYQLRLPIYVIEIIIIIKKQQNKGVYSNMGIDKIIVTMIDIPEFGFE